MLTRLLHTTSLKDWDYDRACRLWLRWHRHVCMKLHWSRDPMRGSLTFSKGFKLWLWKLQCQHVCGPLDDWAHSRKELEVA